MNSILNSVKLALGIQPEDQSFDIDIIIHINSVFMILNQLGVGTASTFFITGATETWEDFLGDSTELNSVKSYIIMKARLIFDPPQSSYLVDSMGKLCAEFEWRLNSKAEEGLYQPVEEVE